MMNLLKETIEKKKKKSQTVKEVSPSWLDIEEGFFLPFFFFSPRTSLNCTF